MGIKSNAYLIGFMGRLRYSTFEGTAWAEAFLSITEEIEWNE